MQAILSNAQHPEYGEVTIPFPIGENEYGRCLELLGKMEIGNPIERDCFIREIQHGPSILQQLVGCNVTVDELDYLAKRLDSFDDRRQQYLKAPLKSLKSPHKQNPRHKF